MPQARSVQSSDQGRFLTTTATQVKLQRQKNTFDAGKPGHRHRPSPSDPDFCKRLKILKFYRERNGSPQYSHELSRHFKRSLGLVAENELLGKSSDWPSVRCVFVLSYSLFYQIAEETVIVLSVWDNRRNPEDRLY